MRPRVAALVLSMKKLCSNYLPMVRLEMFRLPAELLDKSAFMHLPARVSFAAEEASPLMFIASTPAIERDAADDASTSSWFTLHAEIFADAAEDTSMSRSEHLIDWAEKDAALDTSMSTFLPGNERSPLILMEPADDASKSITTGAVTSTFT